MTQKKIIQSETYAIRIKGIVQGVGFRPFIYSLATKHFLKGTVHNDSNGVMINLTCSKEVLNNFLDDIKANRPDLSQIDSIEYTQVEHKEFEKFDIIETKDIKGHFTVMPPDISICGDCRKELEDPDNRRYKYPFITCTNCGPRYTIINRLPYDRVNTSMDIFPMCKECEKEYKDPNNRRYHAQPVGCFNCGPKLELLSRERVLDLSQSKIVEKTAELINKGGIVAIKGVGGYHLVCDASNYEAVEKLRLRKRRPHKPFAIMVKDIASAKDLACINEMEEELLSSKQRPVVLLQKSAHADKNTASNTAPGIDKIGLFLPYTPLHELILKGCGRPLVATSANISDEPLCTNFDELKRLDDVWDYVLDHNRPIVNGCDDSVVAVVNDQTLFFRRARGYAPKAVKLPFKLSRNILSLGANQKSTVAIGFEDNVILSPHIGDLNSIQSVEYFKQNIKNLERIYDFKPDIIICDKHPFYESTKFAKQFKEKLKVVDIQHHYAHITAVMLEKRIDQKVLGVAFDGTGYGDDGNLWGGEFFICDFDSYERIAHIDYFKLLGGEKAIKEPRRVALSLLFDIYGNDAVKIDHPVIKSFTDFELVSLYTAWEKGLNSPLSSSMGRVFDAVASLTDVIHTISYEGQSGAMLESFYDGNIKEYYPFEIKEKIIDIKPVIKALLEEENKIIAVSKFFNTVVKIIETIALKSNLKVVLAGGVFQNKVLLKLILDKIPESTFSNELPPNDGAISLGQIIKGR
jgi:hydrogenase maturation protein HypF